MAVEPRGACAPYFDAKPEFLDQAVHPYLRSASRYAFKPDMDHLITTGFRVVLAPKVGSAGRDK